MIALGKLIFGLGGLWLGTELVIKGAIQIADYYGLSQVFIGLTILAIGSDLPELVVAIDASMLQLKGEQASGLIIGNAIGSCLNQITMVLGIGGLIGYLSLSKKSVKKDGLVLIGALLLTFLVGHDGTITRVEGISLLVVYLMYYLTLLYGEKLPQRIRKELPTNIWQSLISLLGGLILVIVASEIVVHNAITLAELWNVPQSFIGIIFIAFGTSLPELALSINAALKNAPGLSVGNVIGSNIFDLLVPVGIGATISELQVESRLFWRDLPFLLVITVIVLIFFYKKKGLQKKEAVSLIVFYLVYIALKTLGA